MSLKTGVFVGFAALLALLMTYFAYEAGGQQNAAIPPPVKIDIVPYFALPAQADFCGEPVPLEQQDVYERFDREFTTVVHGHAQVYLWLKRAKRYFSWIESQLAANQLPDDIKYLAVAESDLLSGAQSPAGAAGPWQFIPSTGMNYGLRQAPGLDERYDFERATLSGIAYLKDLRTLFQNWTLSAAAYNCGEKRVQDEIRQQKISNYYFLKLPKETERYVFRILAIKEVMGHPEKYGYHLPEGAGYPELKLDRVDVQLPYAVPVHMVAEAARLSYREFKVLNPCFVSDRVPNGAHLLKVPAGSGEDFRSRLETLKSSYRPSVLTHTVEKGDTLTGIAARYDITVESLREWNQIKGDNIQPAQVLRILK